MHPTRSSFALGVLGLAGILAAQAPVKDINTTPATSSPSSSPTNFFTVGPVTYFSATDGLNGFELWKTDGTTAGTVMVKDINPGSLSSSPSNFTLFGGFVYFSASSSATGSELWRTDGTAAGTTLVQDCYPGTGSATPSILTVSGGTLFFSAFDGTATTGTGRELWKSDGTAAGTVLVADILAGTSSGMGATFGTMVPFGPGVLFAATTGTVAPGTGEELWISDGTLAGTVQVKDINVGTLSSAPRALTAFAGKVYFAASDGTAAPGSGTELWVTDGTAAGTTLLKDLYPGTGSSSPEQFVVSAGKLFFSATDSTATTGTGRELYVSDGTGAGTVLVKDLFVGTSSGVPIVGSTSATRVIAPFGTGVLFAGNNGSTVNGEELHFSDGTGAGTVLVADINTGTVSSSPRQLTVAGGKVFFFATTTATGYELFVTDGTGAGTVLTKEIQTGTLAGVTSTSAMAALGGSAVFAGITGTTPPGVGTEPHLSDGTAAGTVLLKDIAVALPASSNPANLAQLGKLTVFAANDGTSGIEPWVTDGTAAGTVLLIDAYPGASSSSPANFTVLGNKCFFTATNSTATTGTGNELYITDGTPAGTALLLDINTGTASSSAINLVVSNGKLFFLAITAAAGRELWVSDGTPAGTTMVVDFLPGASAGVQSFAQSMIPYKNGVIFSGINAGVLSTDAEICFSNGTAAGTYVIDFVPGAPGCVPSPFIEMNGIVYTNATDGANGYELIRTDGTLAGTAVVKDIVPGVGEGNPGPFAVVNNRLYFFATDPATGTELWVSDGTNAGTVLLKDINPGAGSAVSNNPFAANLLVSGNRMFFPATDGTTGIELWTSDGTTPGTVLTKDVNPGAGNGMASLAAIAYPVGVGGKAAFAGDDGVNGSEPWISNGTAAGTTMIANLFPGSTGSSPGQFLTNNAASSILFPATDNVVGRELFAMAAVNVGAAILDPYGVGCPGTGGKIPQISAGAPVIGNAGFSVDVSNAYGPSASALILGVAPAAVPFGPCTIYVDLSLPNLVLSSTTNAAGNGSFSLPLPAVSSYVGISLYFQYLVIDPAGSFLGAATLTGGLRVQLGD